MTTTDFKYRLEKYAGASTRHVCPHCEKPRQFARYVDDQGSYIADNVGRCNREDSCGYHLTPSEYFKNKGVNYKPTINVEKKPLPPTDFIPEKMMVRSLNTENHFLTFLCKHFSLSEVAKTIEKYRLGDTKYGAVIYWQIDEQDRIRTGKMMLYNPDTGRRVKHPENGLKSFDWAHCHVKKNYQLEQCLFGLHLTKRSDLPIAICESEKSAVIASMMIPSYTWMATGGKQNFRLMEAVKGRDVTLYPDLRAYDQWSDHATRYGFKISRLLEEVATPEQREAGLDIADYLINELNKKAA